MLCCSSSSTPGQFASNWAPALGAGMWWSWILQVLLLTHQAVLENQLHFRPLIASSCKGIKVLKVYMLMYVNVS